VANPAKPLSANKKIRAIVGPAPPGRPVSNVGHYLLRPTGEDKAGAEFLNATPQVLKDVNAKYLKAFMLPPNLQPKYLHSSLEPLRARKISRGWLHPRGRGA
jgi:hypothetical protein